MAESKRGKGRPKLDVTRNQTISVRLSAAERSALAEYRRRQPDLPAESEVARDAIIDRLRKAGLL